MGTVFLHVGTMKSGTSYVQSTLNKNADALAGLGISWHGMQETNLAVQDLTASKLSMPGSKGAWDRLAVKVRATDGDTVISMELLGPCSRRIRHKIAESLGRPQLHLVVTWRDVTKVALSHWQENAQNRQEIGWEQYAEEITAPDRASGRPHRFWMHHDVAALLSRWSDVVDPQAMTVITVPSGADQDELWRRFARVIGVPDERARAMPTSRPKNASLGAISAELMLRVNARTRQLGWPQYRLGVKVPLAKRVLSSRAADEPRFALKPEHHKLLRERALTMVDAVAASPASVVGDLQEVIPPVEARPGSFSPGDVTNAELLDAALDGLAGYAGQLNRTRSERDALESALRGSSEAATAGSGRTRTLRTKASAVLRGLRRRVRS